MQNLVLPQSKTSTGGSLAALEDAPIFGSIRIDMLRFLLDRASLTSVGRGNLYFREGDQGSSLYVLVNGTVSVFKQRHRCKCELDELKRGDCFGETAMAGLFPRSAMVQALVDTTAIEITNNVLFDIYEQDVEQFALLQMNRARKLGRRLRHAGQRMLAACCAGNESGVPTHRV